MIKTIQYFAQADPSRVLVALDFKAAFQNNVSRPVMLFSIEQNDSDLAAVFSSTQKPQSTGCTTILPEPTSVPTVVLIGRHLRTVRLRCQTFCYLGDWYLWIKKQYLLQTFVLIAATRSVNLELQPSKIHIWRASCQDPSPPELLGKIKLTRSCLGPIVLGEQAFMEKTTQRFRRMTTTLADLQVCWCSQSARAPHELCARTGGPEL